ncbi:MAG: hypothetical protein JWM96_94 [Alphaproteobacteria bacterium]|nr:hypothetical protein [Alphaproteobacteria bacterium]
MNEEILPVSPEEQEARNVLLRGKKRGLQIALVVLMLASMAPLYFLQNYERANQENILLAGAGMTGMLLLCLLLYGHFSKRLARDMASSEKIVATGLVTRIMLNPRTGVRRALMVDTGGLPITLSIQQLRRLADDVGDLNFIQINDMFRLEFTPHGRHLMRAERL